MKKGGKWGLHILYVHTAIPKLIHMMKTGSVSGHLF